MAGYVIGLSLSLPTTVEGEEARNREEVIGHNTFQGQVNGRGIYNVIQVGKERHTF